MLKNSKCLDPDECAEYLKSPWSKKFSLGLYFSAIHEYTGPIYIYVSATVNNEELWFNTLHSLHDGFDVLRLLNKKLNVNIQWKDSDISKAKCKIKSFLLAIKNIKKRSNTIINNIDKKQGYEFTHSLISFPLQSETSLKTSKVLSTISKSMMLHYSKDQNSRWMIPVKIFNRTGLQASYISMDINTQDDEHTIHSKLVSKLKNGLHWGNYFIGLLGLLLGKKSIRWITRKELQSDKPSWFASYSNLGVLNSNSSLTKLCVLAPVRFHRPIGFVSYELNGKFYLSLSIHNSVCSKELNILMKDIKEKLNAY